MFSSFKTKKIFRYSLSAMNASLLSQTIFYPFDVLRTRFQSHDGSKKNIVPKYKDTISAFKKVYHDEGMRGFYRGLLTTTLTAAINRMIFITLFEMRKQHYRNLAANINSTTIQESKYSFWQKLLTYKDTQNALAAIESGLFSTFIIIGTQPLYLIKTRLMLQCSRSSDSAKLSTNGYENFTNCVSEIYQESGIRGFYKGMIISLMLSSSQVIQLPVYEKLKKTYNWAFLTNQENHNLSTIMQPLSCGILSKIITLCVTYPLTTVQTRIQQNQKHYFDYSIPKKQLMKSLDTPKYSGMFDIVQKIYKYEGMMGFYKGFKFNCIKSLPKGIFFLFYELIKKSIPKEPLRH